jgi:hypothetical protein
VAQTLPARVELQELLNVQNNLVSPNSHPSMGFIQNSLLGAYLLSQADVFLDVGRASALVMEMGVRGGALPVPAVLLRGGRAFWTGKQLVSMCIPASQEVGEAPDVPIEPRAQSPRAFIHKGELAAGALTSANLGRGQGNLLHCVTLDEGGERCLDLMEDLANVVSAYLGQRGFTLGMRDCMPGAAWPAVEFPPGGDQARQLNDLRTRFMAEVEARFVDEVGGAAAARELNAFAAMNISGAKGAPLNAMQIMRCVGPQDIAGGRAPLMSTGRALAAFAPGDRSPASRGFVEHNYGEGLTPPEMFFHTMAGRVGLIVSALQVSDSGTLQRQHTESHKNIKVDHQGMAVDDMGLVVQLLYGEDGLDYLRQRVVRVRFPAPGPGPWEPEERAARALVGARESFELAFDLERLAAQFRVAPDWPDWATQVRGEQREWCAAVGGTELLQAVLLLRFPPHLYAPSPMLRALLGHLGDERERCLVSAGEAVGVVAAQSIGEQMTQKTLNTFHTAGGKAAHAGPQLQQLFYGEPREKDKDGDRERSREIKPGLSRLTVRLPSPDAAARFANDVWRRPLVRTWKMGAAEAPWAARHARVFGPTQGENPMHVVFDRAAFIVPMRTFVERFPFRMVHSHPDYDEEVEAVIFCEGAEPGEVLEAIRDATGTLADSAEVEGCGVSLLVRGRSCFWRVAEALLAHGHEPLGLDTARIAEVEQVLGIEVRCAPGSRLTRCRRRGPRCCGRAWPSAARTAAGSTCGT